MARGQDCLVMALPGRLDGAASLDLQEQIERAARETVSICLDGAAVERIGTQAVQLMLVVSRHLAAQGGGLKVLNASSVMGEAFADLGLSEDFNIWSQS